MRLPRVVSCFSSLCLLGFAAHAAAETTVTFTGQVDVVADELQPMFSPGTPLSGHYTFEGSTPGPDVVTDFQMQIGDRTYTQHSSLNIGGDISVTANEYTAVSFAEGPPIDGVNPFVMALQLSSSTVEFDTSMSIMSLGAGAGIILNPVNPLILSLEFMGGGYFAFLNDGTGPRSGYPFILPTLGIHFRISPSFRVRSM